MSACLHQAIISAAHQTMNTVKQLNLVKQFYSCGYVIIIITYSCLDCQYEGDKKITSPPQRYNFVIGDTGKSSSTPGEWY